MVVRSLDVKKDIFCTKEDDEETLGPEVPHLSAIGALMYHAYDLTLYFLSTH